MNRLIVFLLGLIVLLLIVISTLPYFTITGYAVKAASSNLEVDLPPDYRTVRPEGKLFFTTKLINLADVGRRDVILKYQILDMQNNEVATKSETVAVETQASFVGKVELPSEVGEGNYILRVTLLSTERETISGTEVSFRIAKEEKDLTLYYYFGGGIIVVLIFVLLIFRGKEILNRIRIKSKIRKIVKERYNARN